MGREIRLAGPGTRPGRGPASGRGLAGSDPRPTRLRARSLLIDYGDTAENLEKRRVEGTLRTYRAHHLGPHPLDEPGETDITVDVNFTALIDRAVQLGASVEYHRQDDFLSELGLRSDSASSATRNWIWPATATRWNG